MKVVPLKNFMGSSHDLALRREALVLELAAMQDYEHPHLLTMQASNLIMKGPMGTLMSPWLAGECRGWDLVPNTCST